MTRRFVVAAVAVAFASAVFTVDVALMLKLYEGMGLVEVLTEVLPNNIRRS